MAFEIRNRRLAQGRKKLDREREDLPAHGSRREQSGGVPDRWYQPADRQAVVQRHCRNEKETRSARTQSAG
ncbi:hypothetical protein J7I97_05515 [Streptomyces sp. ISL-87]|nr:hypothetical protein [Streptomyces sp. ISL-87]